MRGWGPLHTVPHVSIVRMIMSLFRKVQLFGFKVPAVVRPFLLKEIPSVCRQDQLLALCEFSDCKATLPWSDLL